MEDYWFKKIKIIELSSVLAGPYAGMLFSELGAEVIKIENKKTNGDVTRKWKNPNEDVTSSTSAYYSSINYNKQSVFMDFTSMNDINKTYELIKSADVVITNFKKGDEYKFALDYGRVKTINRKIIYAKLDGFTTLPEKPAYDVVLQAECGFMSMNGQPTSSPTKMPVALIDVLAGHQLRSGILMALLRKEKTGKGSLVEVSLEASALAALVNQGANYLTSGFLPQRIGSRHPNIAPYGEIIQLKDGSEIVLAIGTDKQFLKLTEILKFKEELYNQYKTNSMRLSKINSLSIELRNHAVALDSKELVQRLDKSKIPYGRVNNMKDLYENEKLEQFILSTETENSKSKTFKTVAFSIK